MLVRSGPAELQQYQDEADAPGKHLRTNVIGYGLSSVLHAVPSRDGGSQQRRSSWRYRRGYETRTRRCSGGDTITTTRASVFIKIKKKCTRYHTGSLRFLARSTPPVLGFNVMSYCYRTCTSCCCILSFLRPSHSVGNATTTSSTVKTENLKHTNFKFSYSLEQVSRQPFCRKEPYY